MKEDGGDVTGFLTAADVIERLEEEEDDGDWDFHNYPYDPWDE